MPNETPTWDDTVEPPSWDDTSPIDQQFKRDELAKETFQARLEGEQAKALTGLTDIGTEAAKAVVRAASHVDPTGFTQGLMQQYGVEPTHVIPPEAVLEDVKTVSQFARQGLGNLGIDPNVILPEQYRKPAEEFVAETIASTPEMAPLLAAGTVAPRPVGRIFQAQMLQGVPQTAYQAFTAPTAEERIKAGIQTGAGLAFPALIERGMRQPSIPIPDFVGRQLEMQRGAVPPRGEPVAPIERVTPEQAAVAAERMSAPFEAEVKPSTITPNETKLSTEKTTESKTLEQGPEEAFDFAAAGRTAKSNYEEALKASGDADAIEMQSTSFPNVKVVISRDPIEQGKWRASRFDEKGASGHNVYDTKEKAISDYTGGHDMAGPSWGWDFKVTSTEKLGKEAQQKPLEVGARGPYKGAFIDDSFSQEKLGYPKAKESLMGWSNDQLSRERTEMIKASLNPMFGRNAKKVLKLIDDEIEARKQKPAVTPTVTEPAKTTIEPWRDRLKELQAQISTLAKKGGLTAQEADQFRALNAEANSIRFDNAKPLDPSKIPSPEERMSTLPNDVVLTARNDLMRDKDVYTPIIDSAIGVAHNADTAVDVVMNGGNPAVSPERLYSAFDATREAIRNKFGDTITLYRAIGKQKDKATTNWATTKAYAKQFGDKVISKQVPVDDIVAVNVGPSGKYHEVIVGKKPTPKPVETPVEAVGNRLAELTAKVESGQKLTASEKRQYLKLRDEATKKQPEAAQAQVSVGPGAAAPLDIAAESAAQSAGIRTAEYINRGLETKDIKTQPDIAVPEADLKSADPQVEARWQAAKLSKPSFIEKGLNAANAAKNAMTRHFRFLDPKTDGVVTDLLRIHENDPLHSKFLASQVMRGITEGLKPKKYDVFSRIVILRDLVKYGEKFGQDLADIPFGYKSWDAVKNDLARFDALAEKYPDIKESLRRRDEFMDALRYDLVARGLINEKVKDFGEYFHHQVLQYMALKEPYASTGSKDVRTHGKSWQKGRTGSAKDYNTSYLESEFEVISQSFAQMATQDTLKRLKAAADISDQLKIAAKDARDAGEQVTWEQLIPEDHTIWQPQQGNHFYWANSITEKALDAYMRGTKQLTEADIKEVLAMGGKREQWVIPKRLAKTLDDFKPPVDNAIEKGIGAGISQWKRWTLFNPMRNVIYELNNLSGDADIAFAVDPKIFKHAPQAAKEVAEFVRAKKGASKEMSDLVRLGVIDSGFSVQELPDLKGNQFFRALEGKYPSLVQRYWENVLDFNRWREGVLRLSSYKRAMELLQSGKKPYWTSKKSEMDALYSDPNVTREQIAAKLAREAIGDYGNISYAGQWIRSKLIPFYSWMEINAPRYVRLMQNASKEEGAAGRIAGVAGKKVATQSAKLAARMSAFYFLANLWNRSMFPEEDRELNSTRDQFHVILHKNADGSITSLRLQGAFSDALSWFGAQDLIKDVKDVQGGLATPQEKAIEMGKAPVNKVAQGAWPIYKTLFEALVKRQTYPDVFNPRPVRDSKAHIARMVSLGSIYDYLAKHPQRQGTWTLKALATYTTDPGEAAYMTAKTIVSDKLKEMNVERPGAEPTEKSNALYYWKQSIRYKNPKLEEYWRNRYFELGGKAQYLDTGLRNTSPYNGVSKANRGKFESLLSPAEQDIMRRADDWYRKVYIER